MSSTGDTPRGGDDAVDPQAHATAVRRAGEQGLLFDERVAIPDDIGYRGPTACAAAGITYRQLDYWARTGLVEPGIRPAAGSGTQRLYSFRDVLVLRSSSACSTPASRSSRSAPRSPTCASGGSTTSPRSP